MKLLMGVYYVLPSINKQKKMNRTIFISMVSLQDAINQAQIAGYKVIGNGRNKRGEFVVFARR